MKKILKFSVLLLAATLIFGFAGCGDGAGNDNNGKKSNGGNNTTNKQAGAAVSAPTLNSKNSNSITINTAAFTAGNPGSQTIEYGRNTSNTAPSSWQGGVTFSGLNADTTYYVFARSKANATYNAGAPSTGLSVTTEPEYDPNRVSTPVTDKPAGSVPYGTEIRLGTTTVGATIYYTTDGNDPTVFSPVFSDTSPIKINAPTTIKAIATATGMTVSTVMTATYTPTYTVTFDSSYYGTIVSPILNVDHGSTITEPTPPTRTNYQFADWYRNSGLTGSAWNFATDTVTADTTLYAKWNATAYTVRFNSNGGTDVAEIMVEPGSKITAPTPPTTVSVECQFVGWYRYSDLTGSAWNFATDTVTADTTLYAKWFNPSLTYNLGDTGPGGGKIFYRSDAGFIVQGSTSPADTFSSYTANYLEAAPNDLSGRYSWGGSDRPNLKDEIGSGRQNTAQIGGTTNYPAAAACVEYTNNGKTDWFLPSWNELWQLCHNKAYVGNMGSGVYWSSSGYYSSNPYSSGYIASYVNFGNSSGSQQSATTSSLVRPIRAF